MTHIVVRTPLEALAFVRRHRVVTMTASPRPSLIEAIVGEPVKGSWWGHPQGKLIFTLAEVVHDSHEFLSLKLVQGKTTFVHKSTWPALARFVMDSKRRNAVKLTAGARALLQEIDRKGSLRLDQKSTTGHKELETSLLAHTGSMHTEKGAHATVITSWSRVFDAETVGLSRQLTMGEARKSLGLTPVP